MAGIPPSVDRNPWRWIRRNLLNSGFNTILTLICLLLLGSALSKSLNWILFQAQWRVVWANLRLLGIGRYPVEQAWRPAMVLGLIGGLVALSWALPRWVRSDRAPWFALLAWVTAMPICFWLIAGAGILPEVPSNLWGGLLLTLLLAIASLVLAFPLGVLLALGRQSQLPVLRWLSIGWIEVVRGLPLIGILFVAQVMLPLFLPATVHVDRITPAIAGLVLFNAAYLAENVRGGLQAIPYGQLEAARALGLNSLLLTCWIVLPQALRAVLPAIVGQFISLFKDTALLSIFALVELTGIAKSILAQPDFLGRYAEVYLFIGLIYWVFCYSMSLASRQLEQHLVGRRL